MTTNSNTAPTGPLCDEPGCGKPEKDACHNDTAWLNDVPGTHPFSGPRELGAWADEPNPKTLVKKGNPFVGIRKMSATERAADPGPIGVPPAKPKKAKPLCVLCQKPGISHRGHHRNHRYTPALDKMTRVENMTRHKVPEPKLPIKKAKAARKPKIATAKKLAAEIHAQAKERLRSNHPAKVDRVIAIAEEIRRLEWQITAKRAELAEMLT